MDYERTFRNWRWWLVLPLALCMAPFALVDMLSVKVVRPVWLLAAEWAMEPRP